MDNDDLFETLSVAADIDDAIALLEDEGEVDLDLTDGDDTDD